MTHEVGAATNEQRGHTCVAGVARRPQRRRAVQIRLVNRGSPVDVVRGKVICETEAELAGLIQALDADEGVKIVRLKNRFSPPEFNG
mmetsp:Transcript_24405/g.73470  ORF Transcript_24405/g.73470 Transcript_24405/m.73470 type:complete len:87 (-) Transcript_24405:148-408(-)